ncbi:MAG: daunorubicin ABC transporter ATP-binding protein [Acidimicrobiales bacterium]|nr:MAG: daunorubicin ABC transporter ATP-binding protein [Acidimicrobiales bacterium]
MTSTGTKPPAHAPAPAIAIEGLRKVYPGSKGPRAAGPVTAVDGIDLEVAPGEVFGLLGPNGAGKTTTVGVCTTRIRPTAGQVRVVGLDVTTDPARVKRSIGVVTQFNTLDRQCNVWENLYLHCRFFAMGAKVARERADELLVIFHLSERAKASVYALSGGMAQRLQLAKAVAHYPKVLFLDEPTAGLDPQSRLSLWDLVRDLKASGTTVLLTTHYMEEADALCDRVAIIDHGQVLACDRPGPLKRSLGADTVVELALTGDPSPVAAHLSTIPGVSSAEPTADGLRVMASGADGVVAQVMEAALPAGLRNLSVTEPTLETVFIALTGRDLRE